jgi:adenylate cyclase class 2
VPNIEIKAVYKDLSKARKIAKGLGARQGGRDRQVDTYFKIPAGRFKLRESRRVGGQLIPYRRPNQKGPKTSDYVLIPLPDPSKTKNILASLLGIDAVVEKQRDLFLLGNIRIHLDRVNGLGNFLEFEAVFKKDTARNRKIEKAKVEKLIQLFEIAPKALLKNSYRELIKK